MTDNELATILNDYQRIAIVGGPGVGKSTLANRLEALGGPTVIHSDVFAGLPWAMQCDALLEFVSLQPPRWICEGITTARALRHGLDANLVIFIRSAAHKPLNPQQSALARKVAKWIDEVRGSYTVLEIK